MTRARTVFLWLLLLTLPTQGVVAAAMLACQHHVQATTLASAPFNSHSQAAAPPCHQLDTDSGALDDAGVAATLDQPCLDCAACACTALPPTLATFTATSPPVTTVVSSTPLPAPPPPALPERPPRSPLA